MVKAVYKGAVLNSDSDTLFMSSIDTLNVRDTVYIMETITNTITKEGDVRYITRSDKREESRLEKRIYKDSITIAKLIIRKNAKVGVSTKKQEEKTERVKVRRESRKSKWWMWILVGYLLNFVVRIALKKITNII
mgnify:CR=1 FL=1